MSAQHRSIAASLGDAARRLLAVAAALLVLWAFVWVGARAFRDMGSAGVTLRVMHWSGGGGQEEDQIVESSLRAFEVAHPGIRVQRINPGDSGQFFTKLQTMMAAGDPPDVFYMDYARLPVYVREGQLVDIEDMAAEQGGLDLSDFYGPPVDAFRWDGQQTGQGQLWGVPKDFTTLGFYVNMDLLRQAGIERPSTDWTWDEFITAARAVGEIDGVTGAEVVTWPFVLRAILWSEGVDVVGDDWNDLRVTDPDVRAVLERLRRWRYDERHTLAAAEAEGVDPSSLFLTGRIGMVGPFGRWVVPSFRSIAAAGDPGGFEWDFLPLPRGREHANVIATVAWSMASGSEHPDEAFELLRWLVSEDIQAEQSRLGLAIPTRRSVAESDAFINASVPPANDRAFLDEVAVARVPQWPADPSFGEQFDRRLNKALRGSDDVVTATESLDRWWRDRLQSPLTAGVFPKMPWWIIGIVVLIVAGVVITMVCRVLGRRLGSKADRLEERSGWLLTAPWMIGFAVFLAGPILLSLLLSFTRWGGLGPIEGAEYVGLSNYARMFTDDDTFLTSLWVTIFYALIAVPTGQIFALVAAMLLNMKVRGVGLYRAAWYLPSVLAGVGIAVLWQWVFKSDGGLMNLILTPILGLFGASPPAWFTLDASNWGVPAFAIMNLWLVGGSMLVYLAGLRNIPAEQYEAASIDGARWWRRFRNVTIPMLSPVILFNVIMAIIGSFQVFTQAFVMTGGGPGDDTRFYVLYLYNLAFDVYEMGYASALAWVLLIVILLLTAITLKVGGKKVYYEGMA
ncbi:MAG: extracellular solute-binding protein [Phycisphaerales bacterium]|nr:extracellular solute-binding protein [Phycisphaerales bacterium]